MRNSENSINSNDSDLFSDKTLKSARAYLETRNIYVKGKSENSLFLYKYYHLHSWLISR